MSYLGNEEILVEIPAIDYIKHKLIFQGKEFIIEEKEGQVIVNGEVYEIQQKFTNVTKKI